MLHALLEAYRHVLALQWGRNWSISMDQQYLASLKKLANSKARKVNKESILQGIQALRNQLV